MAADASAEKTSTQTLVASTLFTVNLTERPGREIELVHHGNVSDVVYYQVADTEAELTSFTAAADNIGVLLSAERLSIGAPGRTAVAGVWVRLLSAGTATVTVNGKF